MTERSEPWLLKRGDEVLAEVHLTPDGDFPWYAGRFVPRPAFEDVRALFEAQDDPADEERRSRAYRTIQETMTFWAPDGPVAEFWLRIHGDRVGFRCVEEPDEDD